MAMANKINDNRIPTLLVVDDSIPIILAAKLQNRFKAGGININVEAVEDMESAAHMVRSPDIKVVGVLLDNNFPFVEGGPARGQLHADKHPTMPIEQQHDWRIEGGAGTMMLNFLRNGTFGGRSESTKAQLSSFADMQDTANPPYKGQPPVPVVWNTGEFETGKLNCITAVAKGKQIDPTDPKYSDPTHVPLEHGAHIKLDKYASAMHKDDVDGMLDRLFTQVTEQHPELLMPASAEKNNWRTGYAQAAERAATVRAHERASLQSLLDDSAERNRKRDALKAEQSAAPEATNVRSQVTSLRQITGHRHNGMRL